MSANARDRPPWLGVDAPVVVVGAEQPVLQVGAVDAEHASGRAVAEAGPRLAHHRVEPVDERHRRDVRVRPPRPSARRRRPWSPAASRRRRACLRRARRWPARRAGRWACRRARRRRRRRRAVRRSDAYAGLDPERVRCRRRLLRRRRRDPDEPCPGGAGRARVHGRHEPAADDGDAELVGSHAGSGSWRESRRARVPVLGQAGRDRRRCSRPRRACRSCPPRWSRPSRRARGRPARRMRAPGDRRGSRGRVRAHRCRGVVVDPCGRDRLDVIAAAVDDRAHRRRCSGRARRAFPRRRRPRTACGTSFESKLKTHCAVWPLSNSYSALTCVGTVTVNSSPARGPEPMMRVSRAFETAALTLATGPNSCTSVVM